jgi:hypothetical protein
MNDGIMEENVNAQTKTNKNPKNDRNHMEDSLCVGVFIVSMIMQS